MKKLYSPWKIPRSRTKPCHFLGNQVRSRGPSFKIRRRQSRGHTLKLRRSRNQTLGAKIKASWCKSQSRLLTHVWPYFSTLVLSCAMKWSCLSLSLCVSSVSREVGSKSVCIDDTWITPHFSFNDTHYTLDNRLMHHWKCSGCLTNDMVMVTHSLDIICVSVWTMSINI